MCKEFQSEEYKDALGNQSAVVREDTVAAWLNYITEGYEMMEVIHGFEAVLEYLVQFAIVIFEFIGVGIIVYAGIKGFINFLRRSPEMKIALAQGLAIGLEFKLGSEILKTVIVRDWTEIVTVAGIIALRAALTFLIHWEIKEEHKDKQEQQEK